MKKTLLFSLLMTFVFCAWAQDRIVKGKVTSSEDASALPGVNIVLKGTNTATVSDADGLYSINVPASGGSLVFSFIGLSGQEVVIGDRSQIDVSLALDVTQLEEVVISGLASTVKRTNLANAVGTISAKELTGSTRATTLDGAMNGKIVGANI